MDDTLARVQVPTMPYRIATVALEGGAGLAIGDSTAGADYEGVVWIVPGPLAGTVVAEDVGTAFPGATESSLGESLAVGDLDGDGLDEVAAGAWTQGGGSGAVYVFGLD